MVFSIFKKLLNVKIFKIDSFWQVFRNLNPNLPINLLELIQKQAAQRVPSTLQI